MTISEYIKDLNNLYQTGKAREHSYRPSLRSLLLSYMQDFEVINEPSRIACGAPDYIITTKPDKGNLPIAYFEAKDVNDADLDGRNSHKEQFDRYKNSLNTIVFTDYLDFHLYENGILITTARIGDIKNNKIVEVKSDIDKFESIIDHIKNLNPQPITSASKLAELMAAKAGLLSNCIKEYFKNKDNGEISNNTIEQQYTSFKQVLINDLTEEEFADVYAQTIAYGFFAARLHDTTLETFSREEAISLIPKSNPFLHDMFMTVVGYQLEDSISWIVDDLVGIFKCTNLKEILERANTNIQQDPMIHFYEEFLSFYDKDLRKKRGVWYTPHSVVRFIVKVVDQILQNTFDISDGIACSEKIEKEFITPQKTKKDKATYKKKVFRVQLLDPATGTGTFLAEAIRQIRTKIMGGLWNTYVKDELIPRVYGFEILMASYAIAHIKLDMLLSETGYTTSSSQRLNVFLTNSLEESDKDFGTLFSNWLSNEAYEASMVKKEAPIMVLIGNPPYNISSSNKSEWIENLCNDYKVNLNERNIQPLSDDYIKFIRMAQFYVHKNGYGIIGFITNNTFIDGRIHRVMRKSLATEFDDIYILNLHGSAKKEEKTSNGYNDENVFNIQQGVCISFFIKKENSKSKKLAEIHYSEIFGSKSDKFDFLDNNDLGTINWEIVKSEEPYYFFVPKNKSNLKTYNNYVGLDNIFKSSVCGIVTARDSLTIKFSDADVINVVNDFRSKTVQCLENTYNLKDSRDWTIDSAKKDIETNKGSIINLLYRPFDFRYSYYTGKTKGFMSYPRPEMYQNISKDNIFLLVCKQQCVPGFKHVFVSSLLVDKCTVSSKTKEACYMFPLSLKRDDDIFSNFNDSYRTEFTQKIGEFDDHKVFCYIYAILHSTKYRSDFQEFLNTDFPKIPYPKDLNYLNTLSKLGDELIQLHLMKNVSKWINLLNFNVPGTMNVSDIQYNSNKVYINKTQYFDNVDENVWNFTIGGYEPLQKWLDYRKHETLTSSDIKHFCNMYYAIHNTIKIIDQIDTIY